ncbi:ribosome-recycling factor [Firmicutes bacterium CAG:884]|nr:ribosome recycling factor [Bacillota bacterium]CCY94049.1 ribosome-recycling factor [Firmicutes bacterium CAG:884]
MEILDKTEEKMMQVIDNLEKRLLNIRAGRANASLVNGIMVEYYGAPTPIMQLANISIPEARQLCIKPYDRSCLSAIEKAIFEANIGLTPNNNGEMIILTIPPLTEDTRKSYVKEAKGMAEDARIALRNVRQDANNEIKKAELTDDDKKDLEEEVQELINKYNKEVEDRFSKKETELLSI